MQKIGFFKLGIYLGTLVTTWDPLEQDPLGNLIPPPRGKPNTRLSRGRGGGSMDGPLRLPPLAAFV